MNPSSRSVSNPSTRTRRRWHTARTCILGGLLLLALAGCGETEGVTTEFEKADTTNSDFTVTSIASGDYPIGLATGSFAGVNAFAVSNYLSGTVSIYIQSGGVGSTAFTRQDVAVGSYPTQILVADLHGLAARPDIAVVTESNNTNNVVVLRNNGADVFSVFSSYAAGEAIQQITAACFQTPCATGALDLAISVPSTGDVRVLLNDGTGNFSSLSASAGGNPGRFVVADFNADSHQDVAVVLPAEDRVRVVLGDGAGNLTSAVDYGTDEYPVSLAAGSFTGVSTDVSLVVSARDRDRVYFYNGNGSGAFTSGGYKSVEDSPSEVVIANFSGNPDVLVVNSSKKVVSFFKGDGAGGFAGSNVGTSESPFDIADGFFTTSGSRDFIVAELKDRVLGVYRGNGAGGFSRTQVAFDSQVTQPMRVNYCGGTKDDVLLVQTYVDHVLLLCNVN